MTRVKTYLSGFLALLIAFAMMPMVAFGADETPLETITIKNAVGGHTYDVYQLVTGDIGINDKGENNTVGGTITNAKPGINLFIDEVKGETFDSVMTDVKTAIDDSETEAALSGAIWSHVTGNPIRSLSLPADTESGTLEARDLPVGYYMIIDNAPANGIASRFIVTLTQDTTITPKVDGAPTFDKIISPAQSNNANDPRNPYATNDQETTYKANTAAIGDYIQFTLKSNVPNMTGYATYKYIIHDTMSAGLTFINDVAHPVIFQFSWTTEDGEEVTQNLDSVNNYLVTGDQNETFRIEITDLISTIRNLGVPEGASITVTYYAQVNENAVIGYDVNNFNTNTAYLQFSNNPRESGDGNNHSTGNTPEKITYTFVNELTINKVREDGTTVLQGAEFELTGASINQVKVTAGQYMQLSGDNTGDWYQLATGQFTQTAPTGTNSGQYVINPETNSPYTYTLENADAVLLTPTADVTCRGFVNNQGQVIFTGLNQGRYTLSETVVPEGYNNINDINFTLSADITWTAGKPTVIWKWDGDAEKNIQDGKFNYTIKNVKGLQLPSTGGIGTVIFTVVGAVVIIGAIAYLVMRRRHSDSE